VTSNQKSPSIKAYLLLKSSPQQEEEQGQEQQDEQPISDPIKVAHCRLVKQGLNLLLFFVGGLVYTYLSLGYRNPVTDVAFHPFENMVAFCSYGESHLIKVYTYDHKGNFQQVFILQCIYLCVAESLFVYVQSLSGSFVKLCDKYIFPLPHCYFVYTFRIVEASIVQYILVTEIYLVNLNINTTCD